MTTELHTGRIFLPAAGTSHDERFSLITDVDRRVRTEATQPDGHIMQTVCANAATASINEAWQALPALGWSIALSPVSGAVGYATQYLSSSLRLMLANAAAADKARCGVNSAYRCRIGTTGD